MNEQELERLIVRIVGDGSSYTKMLQDVANDTKTAAAASEAAAAKLEGLSERFDSVAESVTDVFAVIGLNMSLSKALEEFSEAEHGMLRLKAALEVNGRAVAATVEEYEAYTDELVKMTMLDDDSILALFQQAEAFNITGAAAKKAVQDAIGLAEVTDGSAAAMVRLTAAMARGDTQMAMTAARRVQYLRGVKDEAEFIDKYEKLVASGLAVVSDAANTADGQMKKLEQDFNNILEEAGGMVAEGLLPVARVLRDILGGFKSLPPEILQTITRITMLITAWKTLQLVGGLLMTQLSALKASLVSMFTTTSLAAWSVAIVGAVVVLGALALAYDALKPKLAEFDEGMEKSTSNIRFAAKEYEAIAKEVLERSKGMTGDERTGFLKSKVAEMEADIKDRKAALKALREEHDARASTFVAKLFIPSSVAKTKEMFDEQAKAIEGASRVLAKFKQELKSVTESGMSKELTAEVKKVAEDLVNAYDSIGESADAAKRKRLEMLGATPQALANIDMLTRLKEGAEVTRQYMTPQEKLAEQQRKVSALFISGAISAETYNRAVEKLSDSTKSLGMANAVLAGSAKDVQMQMDYNQMVTTKAVVGDNVVPLRQAEKANKLLEEIRNGIREGLKKKPVQLQGADLEELE